MKRLWKMFIALWPFYIIILIIFVTAFALNTKPQSQALEKYTSDTSNRTEPPDFKHDLSERCKDWVYYRNRAYKLSKEGDVKGSIEAKNTMNKFYNDMSKTFTHEQIADEISKIEK